MSTFLRLPYLKKKKKKMMGMVGPLLALLLSEGVFLLEPHYDLMLAMIFKSQMLSLGLTHGAAELNFGNQKREDSEAQKNSLPKMWTERRVTLLGIQGRGSRF